MWLWKSLQTAIIYCNYKKHRYCNVYLHYYIIGIHIGCDCFCLPSHRNNFAKQNNEKVYCSLVGFQKRSIPNKLLLEDNNQSFHKTS